MKLTDGVEILIEADLLRRAADHKGLELQQGSSRQGSKPVKEYRLDDQLLAALARKNIVRQPRSDCRGIFTLVDEGPQPTVPDWALSNYWNFKTDESGRPRDLRITLGVRLQASHEERGVTLTPQAHGTYVSPADPLPHFRMFRALVEQDADAPAVAKELAASDGHLVVFWSNLGLGGIRQLGDLFAEFVCGNEEVRRLGQEGRVFDPNPFQQPQLAGDERFVVEPAQPRVFQAWRKQLEGYRARLRVA